MAPDYISQAEECYQNMLRILAYNDWKDEGVQKGVKVAKRQQENSSIAMFKGEKIVPGNPKELSEVFAKEATTQLLNKWDSTFEYYETELMLEHGSYDLKIDYMLSNLPWPVWSRDFVILAGRRVDDKAAYHYQCSTDIDTKPTNPKKYVRGIVTFSGYLFEAADPGSTYETSQNTRLVRILHVDPKGSLPGWLINAQATKQIADLINNIAAMTQK